jgi:hypothetical protein
MCQFEGGPQFEDLCCTIETLQELFKDLNIITCELVERVNDESKYLKGLSAINQFVLRKLDFFKIDILVIVKSYVVIDLLSMTLQPNHSKLSLQFFIHVCILYVHVLLTCVILLASLKSSLIGNSL